MPAVPKQQFTKGTVMSRGSDTQHKATPFHRSGTYFILTISRKCL